MRAHTPPRPHHPHRPHPTPASPLPTPGLHFLGVLRVFKGCQCVPTPPAPSPPPPPTPHPTPACHYPHRAHTPPRPHHPHPTPASPLPTPGLHFLGVLRVFKGCQCVPTPHHPHPAHTPFHPGLATTHTWLAFARVFKRLPMRAHTPPRPHHPHRPHHTTLACVSSATHPHLACIC